MEKVRFCILMMVLLSVTAMGIASETNFLGDRHEKNFGVGCGDCHNETPPSKHVGIEKCNECHGTYSELAELTKEKAPNPHESHLDTPICGECHRAHKIPTLVCDSCHQFDMKVP